MELALFLRHLECNHNVTLSWLIEHHVLQEIAVNVSYEGLWVTCNIDCVWVDLPSVVLNDSFTTTINPVYKSYDGPTTAWASHEKPKVLNRASNNYVVDGWAPQNFYWALMDEFLVEWVVKVELNLVTLIQYS